MITLIRSCMYLIHVFCFIHSGFLEFKDSDGLLDDIDLSDDDIASSESSDFTEFEPQVGTTTRSKPLSTKTKDRDGNLDPGSHVEDISGC